MSYKRDIEDCVIFECCAAPGEDFDILWYVLRIAHAALLMNVSMSAGSSELAMCPKPPIQPRDAARRGECSQLDEKSLTTFSLLNGRAKGSDGDNLNDFKRLKNYSKNDAPDRVVSKG